MKKYFGIILLLFQISWVACRPAPKPAMGKNITDGQPKISYLDSIAAAQEIIREDVDSFFQKINAIDIQIQMKRPKPFDNITEAKDSFRRFLQSEVLDFQAADTVFLGQIMNEAFARIKSINPKLIPPQIQFVKIRPNHYGKDVYYTRNETIFVPENIFENPNLERQLPIFIHEIWHILSRKNPVLREQTYPLIGFKRHGLKLQYPEELKKQLLTNPDGAMDFYYIQLQSPTAGLQKAIPLIFAGSKEVKPGKAFFDYLQFDLYLVNEHGQIQTKGGTKTSIPMDAMPDFFRQIKDNTQYIIHPEEIMADNFMLLVNTLHEKRMAQYSPQGKKLAEELLKILKAF